MEPSYGRYDVLKMQSEMRMDRPELRGTTLFMRYSRDQVSRLRVLTTNSTLLWTTCNT